jgi:hypothetical protein
MQSLETAYILMLLILEKFYIEISDVCSMFEVYSS